MSSILGRPGEDGQPGSPGEGGGGHGGRGGRGGAGGDATEMLATITRLEETAKHNREAVDELHGFHVTDVAGLTTRLDDLRKIFFWAIGINVLIFSGMAKLIFDNTSDISGISGRQQVVLSSLSNQSSRMDSITRMSSENDNALHQELKELNKDLRDHIMEKSK